MVAVWRGAGHCPPVWGWECWGTAVGYRLGPSWWWGRGGAANRAVSVMKPLPPDLDWNVPRVWGNVRHWDPLPLEGLRGSTTTLCPGIICSLCFFFCAMGPHSGGHLPVLQEKMGSLWLSIHSLC